MRGLLRARAPGARRARLSSAAVPLSPSSGWAHPRGSRRSTPRRPSRPCRPGRLPSRRRRRPARPPRGRNCRTVTVLAAEVAAPAGLARELDPESLRDVIGRSLAAVIAEVEALGGTVTSVSGQGLQAMFGAPEAHEDDPERAARAAFRCLVGGGGHRRRQAGAADRGGDRPGRAGAHRRRRPGRVRSRGRGRGAGRRAAVAGQAGVGAGGSGDPGRHRAPVQLGRHGSRWRLGPEPLPATYLGEPRPARLAGRPARTGRARPARGTAGRAGGARGGPARGGARARLGRAGDRRARARQDPPGPGVPHGTLRRGPRSPVAGGALRLLRLIHALRPLPATAGQLDGRDARPARGGGPAGSAAGAGRGAGRRPVSAAGPHDGPAAGSGAGTDEPGGAAAEDVRRLAFAGVPPDGDGPGGSGPGGPALGRPDLAAPHPRPGPAGAGPPPARARDQPSRCRPQD